MENLSKITEPMVSVILPVYNRPAVVDTVLSILRQSYRNFELLIIDNASTDHTCDLIEAIEDCRIKLLKNKKNMGQTFSLNRGLSEAKGKYIARIDSDDIALPDRLMKQVNFMENNPDFVLCGSWVKYISDDDELLFTSRMCTTDKGMRVMHTIACGIYHSSAMYRRDVIEMNHIKYADNITMAEDYDLWVKLMKHGKAQNIPEVLLYYRRGNSNDSRKHSDTMGRESTAIRIRVCKQLPDDNLDKPRLLKEIKREGKNNKTLIDTIKIFCFYRGYLNRNIDSKSLDYTILWEHMLLKIYSSCIASNNRLYAGILRMIYHKLKNKKK